MTSNDPGVYVIEVTVEKCHRLVVGIALDLVAVDPEVVREVEDVEVIAVDVTAVAVVVMMVDVLFMTNPPIKSMVPRQKQNGVSRWIISLLDAVGKISKISCEKPERFAMVQLMEMWVKTRVLYVTKERTTLSEHAKNSRVEISTGVLYPSNLLFVKIGTKLVRTNDHVPEVDVDLAVPHPEDRVAGLEVDLDVPEVEQDRNQVEKIHAADHEVDRVAMTRNDDHALDLDHKSTSQRIFPTATKFPLVCSLYVS